ncbi:MBL fold metallo-hydrolase [Flavilitoribacter nigricans]|uniref:Metallo-beta-lactamase domain-containing protein n=1 Tax=Flavilitoribacter nigricans (strain ATCC 23147 / DSM 23189 / NBRC 102662 / NCIMB 1420 / SS-2) TaxID=1122177 RepID=A0A2D0N9Q4_FLAN2|nr:MBL fold metallo-hydrolase [Flavilitoribacter nigricans]PHN05215.1 hypothetical protein CRP01_16990 [Flavilitoribacter nigricans DSM 23189 = NBRC 102662]
MRSKQFGGKPTKTLIDRYQQSDNWQDGKFQNLEFTDMDISLYKIPGIIYQQLTNRAAREPAAPLPLTNFNRPHFLSPSESARFIWYGHSALLLRLSNRTILIDPMLGPNASPIAPFPTRRFSSNTLELIDEFPEIDLLLLTHDHYDHLDFASIKRLQSKTKNYFVALGVKRHLVHWGIDPDRIVEFDWWEKRDFRDISVTFTPTRHFSGRGLTDRAKSLWGGWVFRTASENIWFSGDGGYGSHFKEIGDRLGPFDFAFMECGQYNEHWALIHLFPEESIQAAMDAGARKVMPVHWGGFSLAPHTWTDPVERFHRAATEHGLPLTLPQLGKPYLITENQVEKWWVG